MGKRWLLEGCLGEKIVLYENIHASRRKCQWIVLEELYAIFA
jgi:hypothetical protein